MSYISNFSELLGHEMMELKSKFNSPSYYINRELSWLEFNTRVLHQALRKEIPLLERLKFLGITASNLDEFIMVRFASVLNKQLREFPEPDIAGMGPQEEYEALLKGIVHFKELQEQCCSKLLDKLDKQNITISKFKHLDKNEKDYVEKLFTRFIYPLLTPITIDTTNDFPLIKSKQLCIIVTLEDKKNPNLEVVSLIPIDAGLERIYKIEVGNDDEQKYILLEEIIMNFLNKIFINKTVTNKGCMRILREADIELDHNKDVYIVDRMRQTLVQREFSKPIFMDIDADIPKDVLKIINRIFDIEKRHIFKARRMVDMSFLAGLPIRNDVHEYEPFIPQYPEELIGEHDMFTAIEANDILLHHPYETFGPVIKFLEHAADDKDVLAIKQTLYRVSSDESPIVEALCRAAEKGKQVSVLVEIKARFDEDRNMSLIEKLKISGCKLIFGIEELKTHCKFIVVVRKGTKSLKTFCHLGTGNYNDKTSSIYTDISYFTSNSKMGDDLLTIFNILSGFSDPKDEISKVYYAPYNLRSKLVELIDRETDSAKKGKKSYITLKLNSLSDQGIIKKLYNASEHGVKITIFCRGICSMKTINKNITIKSVIGRYLEHSRIYYFYNGGKPDVFISSADLLTRNLDRRVEVLIPITETGVKTKLLNILMSYFKDVFNTYFMDEDGKYKLLTGPGEFNVHDHFMQDAITKFRLRDIPKITLKQKKK